MHSPEYFRAQKISVSKACPTVPRTMVPKCNVDRSEGEREIWNVECGNRETGRIKNNSGDSAKVGRSEMGNQSDNAATTKTTTRRDILRTNNSRS